MRRSACSRGLTALLAFCALALAGCARTPVVERPYGMPAVMGGSLKGAVAVLSCPEIGEERAAIAAARQDPGTPFAISFKLSERDAALAGVAARKGCAG